MLACQNTHKGHYLTHTKLKASPSLVTEVQQLVLNALKKVASFDIKMYPIRHMSMPE